MLIFLSPSTAFIRIEWSTLGSQKYPRPPEVLGIQYLPWIFQKKRGMREREKEGEGEREGEGDFSVNPKSLFLSLKTELMCVCVKSLSEFQDSILSELQLYDKLFYLWTLGL